jgi:3-methyladenine DNA glycosylase AlkC
MAEPLKNQYGPEIPRKIADMIRRVDPSFPHQAFLKDALAGYEALELMPRGRHLSRVLRRHLPGDYAKAVKILLASQGPKLDQTEGAGLAPFLYMPHVFFVAEYGADHFDVSMKALYELTQRFTAEFSIRPFLDRDPERVMKVLHTWTQDPSPHVRRLVSEGTRPRLPWASRLRSFQKDPRPVLALLGKLKEDPEIYVRRSVANNLNDIGKDHPEVLLRTAKRWMKGASGDRQRLVRHALRTLIKNGNAAALEILGFGGPARAAIKNPRVETLTRAGKNRVQISFTLVNREDTSARFLVDFRIHYLKSSGRSVPKVFKLTALELSPRKSVALSKSVSLENMTTRRHFPGRHAVDALVNGRVCPLGAFLYKKPI